MRRGIEIRRAALSDVDAFVVVPCSYTYALQPKEYVQKVAYLTIEGVLLRKKHGKLFRSSNVDVDHSYILRFW